MEVKNLVIDLLALGVPKTRLADRLGVDRKTIERLVGSSNGHISQFDACNRLDCSPELLQALVRDGKLSQPELGFYSLGEVSAINLKGKI